MLHTKSHQNQHSGSWKEDFFSFFTICGNGSHLGHVTEFFSNLYLQVYIQNLVENNPVVLGKIKFNFHMSFNTSISFTPSRMRILN